MRPRTPRTAPRARTRIGWDDDRRAPLRRPHPCLARLMTRLSSPAGSRGIGRAIALRFARAARSASRSATCGTTARRGDRGGAARRRRGTGARPRQRHVGARARRRSGARAARRARAQRSERRDPPRARDRGEALGVDADRERARTARPRARDGAADAGGILDRRHLVARRAARARELRAHRDVEGCARVARPLPRRRARPRDPGERRVSPGSSRPTRSSTFRTARDDRAQHEADPVGRLVEPEDVADAVEFLCSPAAKMSAGRR